MIKLSFNSRLGVALLIFPLIYNALLAIFNAHIASIGVIMVAFTEALILMMILLVSYKSRLDSIDFLALAMLVISFFSLLITYIHTGILFVDHVRNTLIIVVAFVAGRKLEWNAVFCIYKSLIIIFGSFLLVEIFLLVSYVELFNPPLYFVNTRGFEMVEANEIGVFSNAIGFEGRFSFGVFDGPRTSSLMLEQVSFSYLNIVLILFTMAYWSRISIKWRVLFVIFSALVLLTNESRLALIMTALFFIGYYLFPFMHRVLFAYFPFFLLAVGLTVSTIYSDVAGDNFIGRIVYSFDHFYNLTLSDYFGAGALKVGQLFDSGYTYLVSSGTIFGAVSVYLFTIFAVYSDSATSRRYAYGLIIYFWLALMIAGTSVFSIKSSFLLWLFAGYVVRSETHA